MTSSVKKESKLLAYHTFVYGIGNLLNRVIGFLMIPVYTRFFSPSDYGVLELVTLTTQIVSIVATSSITGAIGRFYFQYEDTSDRDEVLSTAIITLALLSLIVIIPLCLLGPQLSLLLFGTIDFSSFFFISIITIWTASLSGVGFLYMQIQKQSTRFLMFSASKLLVALGLNILFIVHFKIGIIGVLYSTLISSTIFMIFLVVPILFQTGLRFSKKKCMEILKFSVPIIPASLGNLVVLSSDRFFLSKLVSVADTGLYSLACRFSIIPGHFISYPFMQIWNVRRLEVYKEENSEILMGRVFTYFCLLIISVGLGISLLAQDVIIIMADSKFWTAYKAVPVLVLAQVIASFFQHFNFGIIITKKTKFFSYIDVTNGIINLALNYFLIRKFGIMGAAYATLISSTMRVVMVYVITMPLYKIHFEVVRVTKLFTAAFILYAFSLLNPNESVPVSVLFNVVLICSFPVVLLFECFFSPQELEFGKAGLRKVILFLRLAH